MTDIKSKVQSLGLDANIRARNVHALSEKTGNIYETLAIIQKRASFLIGEIKQELNQKLEEFAINSDTIEEVSENKEQIEISKFYEKLPNPAIIAMEEFNSDELYHRYNTKKEED